MTLTVKHTYLILLIAITAFSRVSSQTPFAEAKRTAEMWPQWPGCDTSMTACTKTKLDAFIASNLKIPAEAKAQGLGGVVMVEFVIEKNGSIGEVKTLHDPGSGLGTEAVRVVSMMKEKKIKWTPAEEKGKRVPFRYMTPVSFNLTKPAGVAKKEVVQPTPMPEVFDVVDVMPMYAGCTNTPGDTVDCTFISMLRHFQTNLKYPDAAKTVAAQGPVVIEFVIDAQGNVTKPVVREAVGHGCDEEALRVISMMPKWQPGLLEGKPVAVRMVVPIMFQAPREEKE